MAAGCRQYCLSVLQQISFYTVSFDNSNVGKWAVKLWDSWKKKKCHKSIHPFLTEIRVNVSNTSANNQNQKEREHISPVLAPLHWLAVTFRIDFKVICFIYKTLNGLGPSYTDYSLVNYLPSRTLIIFCLFIGGSADRKSWVQPLLVTPKSPWILGKPAC